VRPPRTEPVRTCVGCRQRGGKRELVRVVRTPEGPIAVDQTGRAAGRGAYLHPDQACLQRAARAGSLARALRTSLDPAETARLMQDVSATGMTKETKEVR
jgi:predicted RNA-binding protein YlxR (DUF448 family)